MPNIDRILQASSAIAPASRAAAAWGRILEKPSSIVIVRGKNSTALAVQTVRIEYSDSGGFGETQGKGGMIATQREVTVFGIRDHAKLADTNIQRGDLFTYEEQQFRVRDVVLTIGEIQAHCEAS